MKHLTTNTIIILSKITSKISNPGGKRFNMARNDINKIIEIIKNDFKASFSNPIVIALLIAVIILPSLYALMNIQACWDPYENTDQVEFAIANLDNGTTFQDMNLNIGNELVKELKNNTKFKWTFVTEKELRDGVNKGDYYAGIVIPKNLSENIVSITGDDPKQAEIEYIVNIKSNPVATRLTDAGANAIYTSLNAKIVEVINLAAYGKLGELQSGLASGASQLSSGGSQLSAGAAQVSEGASQVAEGESQVTEGAAEIESHVGEATEGAQEISEAADQVSDYAGQIQSGAEEVEKGSEELQAVADPSLLPDGAAKSYIEGNVKLANGSAELGSASSELASGSAQLAGNSSLLASGSAMLAGNSSLLAGGSAELAEGSLALAAGAELLSNSAAQALFTAAGALSSSANSLSAITGINETQLGDYFLAPIKLDRHEVYPVPDYGSLVTPFYVVLSMWVGALITCVLIEPKSSTGTKYTPFEMYSGQLVFFVLMSILQACVTIGGAYIMGVYMPNPEFFIPSAILISAVFMILLYSIISAIGTVGKGVCVILLVLQISSTGGIYPIQILPKLFQDMYYYLPMTYAIKLLREAQLGMVWSNYLPALAILLTIGIITVIVSILIKTKADKASKYFEERLKESGLF